MVMFIHRPEYYKKNPTPEEEGIAEIIIAKQRNGPTGSINLAFIKDITRFENLAKYAEEPILEENTDDDIMENINKNSDNTKNKDNDKILEEISVDDINFDDFEDIDDIDI